MASPITVSAMVSEEDPEPKDYADNGIEATKEPELPTGMLKKQSTHVVNTEPKLVSRTRAPPKKTGTEAVVALHADTALKQGSVPKERRKDEIKEAIGQLIGPTEVAPEVMQLFKQLDLEQKRVAREVHTCQLQFKSLEGLRLDQITEELKKHDLKLNQQ